jgi:hypothetical protein
LTVSGPCGAATERIGADHRLRSTSGRRRPAAPGPGRRHTDRCPHARRSHRCGGVSGARRRDVRDARSARRDLQVAAIAMVDSYDATGVGNSAHRRSADRLWPVVVSVEYLAYQVLSGCWDCSTTPPARPRQRQPIRYAHWSERATALREQIAD